VDGRTARPKMGFSLQNFGVLMSWGLFSTWVQIVLFRFPFQLPIQNSDFVVSPIFGTQNPDSA
jgi:hypothetical protein